MATVSIHPPKTPVTKGSNGIAAATLPNVCKMPGPPAPFVPTPLPNIGKSDKSAQGYSTTVKIEGETVAIKGATFQSMGDIASKGTGGGMVSANAEGVTKFITPGSMTVKMDGKSVHLLGEPMLNNCGASGSPPNTGATMAGVMQAPLIAQAVAHDSLAEIQEICDIKCDCQATGQGQNCISNELKRRDKASGYTRNTKAEVPYNMKQGDKPSPYMSKNDPRRQTDNWFIPGHRRPDAVIVRDSSKPWMGDNIKAVVEVKMKDDPWRKGQRKAYERIAGDKEKVIEVNDENCTCPNNKKPEPVPVPIRKPYEEKEPSSVTKLVPVLAAVAVCVAVAAAAPAVAVGAAAVAVFALFTVPNDSGGSKYGGA